MVIKKRNELLNIMEAIAALLVIWIHFEFPGQTGDAVTAVARISVPFFFCISGYFFYKGNPEQELKSIPRKIKRLLRLILMSETIYFLFYLLLQIDNLGFTVQALRNVVELEILKPYYAELANRLSIFTPPLNGMFWFVGSLVVVYGCAYFAVRYGWQRGAFIISLVLLLIGLLLRRVLYYGGVHTRFPYERLLPFLPVPFFVGGYYIRKYQYWFDQISDRTYYVTCVVGVALTLLEEQMCAEGHTLYFGTLLLVPAMVSFGGKHKDYIARSIAGHYFSHVGADTATYIYMFHGIVGNILSVIIPRFLPIDSQQKWYIWSYPILVSIASVICAEAAYLLKRVFINKR